MCTPGSRGERPFKLLIKLLIKLTDCLRRFIKPAPANDISCFRLSSAQLRNDEVGYFLPLLRAVRVMILIHTFYIGVKYSGVLYL